MYDFLKDFGVPGVLVGAITFLTIAYKQYATINEKRLRTTKNQLDSLIDVMGDDKKRKEKFIVEQAFSYKFKANIPYSVIEILLDTRNPTTSIHDYIKGKIYLDIDNDGKNLNYVNRMEKDTNRKRWKTIHATIYFLLALPGVILLAMVPSIYSQTGPYYSLVTFFLAFSLLFWTYLFLDFYKSLNAAERVMDQLEQNPNIQNSEGGSRPKVAQSRTCHAP